VHQWHRAASETHFLIKAIRLSSSYPTDLVTPTDQYEFSVLDLFVDKCRFKGAPGPWIGATGKKCWSEQENRTLRSRVPPCASAAGWKDGIGEMRCASFFCAAELAKS
jgi:hypothetical protein